MRLPKNRLFDYNTPGPGVSKDEPPKHGIALFWDILYRRFWKMVTLNAVYLLFSIPGLIIQWFATYMVLTLICSEQMNQNPEIAATITQITTYLTCLIYTLFGGGAVTAGMTKVVTSYRIDTHSWLWSDFKDAYKKHFLKATGAFVFDTVMLALMGVNFWFYGMFAGSNIIAYLLQGLMVVIFLIFLLMHAYVYPIMVSCEDKGLFEIYKNSFILAIGKLPVTLGSIAACTVIAGVITYLACFVAVYAMLFIPIIMFVFVSYVNLFITYPVIQKYILKSN